MTNSSQQSSSLAIDLGRWLPQWLRSIFLAEPAARIVHFDDKESSGVSAEPSSMLESAGREKTSSHVVDVILPDHVVLKRNIAIPPSSVAEHYSIAELDLVRRTPFDAKEIFWALDSNHSAQSTSLRQWVAKKEDLERFRSNLASHGYQVRRFLLDSGEESTSRTVLADFTWKIAPRAHLWRRSNAIFCVLALCFGAYIWVEPAVQARTDMQQTGETLEEMRKEAVSLRGELEQLQEIDQTRMDLVNAIKHRSRVIDAIRQLTIAMPDTFWASEMLFTQDEITLTGETSQSASDLVLQLTKSDFAYIPALTGAVSRTATGNERFGIVFSRKIDPND